jgi:hypothetical protein
MRKRAIGTMIAVAALAAVTTAPARATVVEKGRFADEAYGFSYDCGFPVEVTGSATGNFRLRAGKGDRETAFFSLDRLAYSEIHTNVETGAWFGVSGRFAENELTARRVDGSVFEFRSIKAGPVATLTDSDGDVVARDRGVLRRTILFDTLGDDVPGGEFVELLDVDLAGPHESFDRLCDYATELIGS